MARRLAFAVLALPSRSPPATRRRPRRRRPPAAGAYASLPAGVSPPGFKLPEGAGCTAPSRAGRRSRTTTSPPAMSASRSTTASSKDIDQASAACEAGRDAEAQAMVRASRVRNGYPDG